MEAVEKPLESGGKTQRPVSCFCSVQNNPAPDDANKRKKELAANLLDRVSLLVTDPAHANYTPLVCVFIPICKREISILFGDHRGSSWNFLALAV